ncbi:MAG: translation initiation factor IF-3 [Armatimonadetes bacterium]|nr:translation initiation factor IF-3 [Armatimonadota bacterium]
MPELSGNAIIVARFETVRRETFGGRNINHNPRYDRGRDLGPRVNERIRVREILVIDDQGNKLGPMTPREALDIARGRGLDLVEVAPTAQPPVCRIVDYGKYKYEQGKKDRDAAKKQRQAAEIKGMTLRPGTDDHDLDFKIKNIIKFLGDGDKVKVTVRFRSREMTHPEFAQASLKKIVDMMTEAAVGIVERPATMEGKQMIMVLAPAKETAPKKPAGGSGVPKEKPAPAPKVTIGDAIAASGGSVPTTELAETSAPASEAPASAPVETPAPTTQAVTETASA